MSESLPPDIERPFWATRDWWYRAGHTSLGLWLGTALAFVATLLAARALGPLSYGSVILTVSLTGLIFTLLDLTLDEAVVFHGTKLLEAEDVRGLRDLLATALTIDALNGLVVLGATVALASAIAEILAGGLADPSLVRVGALAAFATTLNGTTGGVLMLARRPELRAWMTAWSAGLRVVAVLFALGLRTSPMAVVSAFAGAAAIGAISQGVVAWRVARDRWTIQGGERETSRASWIGPLVAFGFHSSVATSVLAGRGALLPVVFGRIAGVDALGLFSVGMFPVSAASIATSGLRMSLFPEQARLTAAGDHRGLLQSVRGHVYLGLAVGVPAAIAGYLVLPWLIPLIYSSEFSRSVAPARILLVAAVLYLALGWTKTLPAAVGRPGLRTIVSVADLSVSTLLIWGLAGFGPEGAATAVSIATAILAIVWWFVLRSIEDGMKRGKRIVPEQRSQQEP